MVPEIATALTGLAMTVGDSGWSPFAGSAVVDLQCTAERAMPVPYIGCPYDYFLVRHVGVGPLDDPLGSVANLPKTSKLRRTLPPGRRGRRPLQNTRKNPPIPENRGISI